MCWERVDPVVWSAKCVLGVRETGGQVLELFWLLGKFRTSVLSKYLLEGDGGGSIGRWPIKQRPFRKYWQLQQSSASTSLML